MTSVYRDPSRTEKFLAHIEQNFEKIQELRKKMHDQSIPFHERTIAFSELYILIKGDPHAQRRLVVDLEMEAKRERNLQQRQRN